MNRSWTIPARWLFVPLGLLAGLTTAFVVFRPVQVVPRIAAGPEYQLNDQNGEAVGSKQLAGSIVLYGFGYTYDPTGGIDRTLEDMGAFQEQFSASEFSIEVVLILFDDVRDTAARRQEFAESHAF